MKAMPLSPKKPNKRTRRRRLFNLSLYVAGTGARSLQTIQSVTAAFEQHAAGLYSLTVVDIYRTPEAASEAQIIAVPTLVLNHPRPTRIFVGNFPTAAQVAKVLRIRELAA